LKHLVDRQFENYLENLQTDKINEINITKQFRYILVLEKNEMLNDFQHRKIPEKINSIFHLLIKSIFIMVLTFCCIHSVAFGKWVRILPQDIIC